MTKFNACDIISIVLAGVLELADETDSKSVGGNVVWVQVPPPAPSKHYKKDIMPTNGGAKPFAGINLLKIRNTTP